MPSEQELLSFITHPREDLYAEYKGWLDLSDNSHKAVLAKAAIALANHGGGFIVIGFPDDGGSPVSSQRPPEIPEITQDAVNSAVKRYSSTPFQCQLYNVEHPKTEVRHPVISVPGNLTAPVMSKRSHPGTIDQNRCYIRKPGPASEEPRTEEEWRTLLDRCIREGRNELLDALRSILHGHVKPSISSSDPLDDLTKFCEAGRERWSELVETEPDRSPARFPHGHYEMGFSLSGAQPLNGLSELKSALHDARRIGFTGWPPFLAMSGNGWGSYPYNDYIERRPNICDFWRASCAGELYTIRGYTEDGLMGSHASMPSRHIPAGEVVDLTLPIWRVGEALLFAERFAATFDEVHEIFIYARFTGLQGRKLVSLKLERILLERSVSMTDEIVCVGQETPENVRNNLVEILHRLLSSLYEKFDFYKLEARLVREEIERMRTGRF